MSELAIVKRVPSADALLVVSVPAAMNSITSSYSDALLSFRLRDGFRSMWNTSGCGASSRTSGFSWYVSICSFSFYFGQAIMSITVGKKP